MTTKPSPATLDKVEWVFPTVAAMKAETRMSAGDHARTTGYLTDGDGGGASYLMAASGSADGYLDHETAEGLIAALQFDRHMRAEWAGVVPAADGTKANRRAAFQAAFYRIADLSRDTRFDDEYSVTFSCDTDFLTDGVLHLTTTAGGTCEVGVRITSKVYAIGGGGFEAQFDLDLTAAAYSAMSFAVGDRSDRALKDPRTDATYNSLWGGSSYVNPADLLPIPLYNVRIQRSEVYLGKIDCQFWCSGVRFRTCTATNFYIEEVFSHRTYGLLTAHASNGGMKIWNAVVKQWALEDDGSDYDDRVNDGGALNMANYTGDCQVSCYKDWMVIGGFYGWSRSSNLLLGQTPTETDPLGTGTVGQNCYWDGLASSASGNLSDYLTASQGTGDNIHIGVHVMQGFGSSSTTPRWDRIYEGGPVSYEIWNDTNKCYIHDADIDASTVQIYGNSVYLTVGSYITAGSNQFPIVDGSGAVTTAGDRIITVDPRIRIYADGTSNPSGVIIQGIANSSIGFFSRSGMSDFDGDYGPWNARNRQASGAYEGSVQFSDKPFMALLSATRAFLGLTDGVCRLGLNPVASQGDQWLVVEDGTYGTGTTTSLTRGQIVTALVNNPGAAWGSNWAVSNYSDVTARSASRTASIQQPIEALFPRDTTDPYFRLYSPGGSLKRRLDVAGDTYTEDFDGTTLTVSFSDAAGKVNVEGQLIVDGWNIQANGGELTIASGEILPTSKLHTVDTEGDAASDDLVNILATNAPAGAELFLRIENNGRVVVIKHGTGNILCNSGTDFTLDSTSKVAHLVRIGTNWHCVNG